MVNYVSSTRKRAVNVATCPRTNRCFSFCDGFCPRSYHNNHLKRSSTGRSIFSINSLTVFDVLHSIIVLPAAQVLLQSSEGRDHRAEEKRSVDTYPDRLYVVQPLFVSLYSYLDSWSTKHPLSRRGEEEKCGNPNKKM